jgi:hypothetical protein
MGAAFLGPPSSTASHIWAAELVERFQSSNHTGCSKRPHPVDGKPKSSSAHPRRRSIWTARVGRLNQGLNLPNLCPRGPTDRLVLACVEPPLVISVAVTPRSTRTSSPTVHPAPAPISYRRLPAGVTGAGLCPTSASFGHIRQPPLYIGLTHGVVCHFWSPPSRCPALTIPTSPWAPEWMWRCRTSTVCLWPRRCRSRAWIKSSWSRKSLLA